MLSFFTTFTSLHTASVFIPSSSQQLPPKRRVQLTRQRELAFDTLPSFWIAPTQICSWLSLPALLSAIHEESSTAPDGDAWDNGAYHPTPTIIDAALALRLVSISVRLPTLKPQSMTLKPSRRRFATSSQVPRRISQHVICFLTGVPGSGKTLVGLSLAHLSENRTDAIHFMSGMVRLSPFFRSSSGSRECATAYQQPRRKYKRKLDRKCPRLRKNVHR